MFDDAIDQSSEGRANMPKNSETVRQSLKNNFGVKSQAVFQNDYRLNQASSSGLQSSNKAI